MKKNQLLITALVVCALFFTGCTFPVQVKVQQSPQPQAANPQDDTNTHLKETVSALETRMASTPASANPAEASQTNTPLPSPTLQPSSTSTTTVTPTTTSTPITQTAQAPVVYITPLSPLQTQYPSYPSNTCNRAAFVADVTVPDNTNFSHGAYFTKTWRLRNDGICTWTTGYALVFDHGYSLEGPGIVSMPTTVAPGMTVDISVNLRTPNSDGVYQGFWKLQDASGVRFGIGSDAQTAFWVKITVGVVEYPTAEVYGGCEFVSMSPDNYSRFAPNSDLDVRWTVKNMSTTTWETDDVDYRYINGTKMYKNSSYDLQTEVTPGHKGTIIVDVIAPSSSGAYSMTWGVYRGKTRLCTMSITIYVK